MTMLELDDIQSGVLRPRPSPYAATYILLRIDDRRAGRELMGRLAGVVASAAHPTSPARPTPGSASRSPTRACEALGVPQDSLDSFAWEFQQGMAARAKALGDIGESSPEHWERPLGTSDVHVVARRRSRRTSARLEAALGRARAGVLRTSRGSSRSGARTATRWPPAGSPSGSGTASAIRRSKAAASPAPTPSEQPLKAGEFVLGYPDETGGHAADASTRGPGPQRHLRGVPQAAPARGGVPPVPEGERGQPRRRGAAGGQDDGALAQRRAAGAVPARTTTRSWAPIRDRNNDFMYSGRRDRVQDAARVAHPASESARRVRGRRRPAAPDDPPRDRVRPRAARGRRSRTTASIAG